MNATPHPTVDDSPLNDPDYEPRHRPINGKPNLIIARWGPRSQIRWFSRFWPEMGALRLADVQAFHCHSVEHKGPCCGSCIEDEEMGYDYIEDHCCCRALRDN